MRPVRAKAFIINAFALTGRIAYNNRLPRVLPWAMRNLGFQPASLEFLHSLLRLFLGLQASICIFDSRQKLV